MIGMMLCAAANGIEALDRQRVDPSDIGKLVDLHAPAFARRRIRCNDLAVAAQNCCGRDGAGNHPVKLVVPDWFDLVEQLRHRGQVVNNKGVF